MSLKINRKRQSKWRNKQRQILNKKERTQRDRELQPDVWDIDSIRGLNARVMGDRGQRRERGGSGNRDRV